jgi:hypothetical protein
MKNARVTLLFESFNKETSNIKTVRSLRKVKTNRPKVYRDIKNFLKTLEYSKKQMIVVRTKLLESIKKLGSTRSCKSVEDLYLSSVVGLEVFFESRFRMEKGSEGQRSRNSAMGLIESIEKQIRSQDYLF